MNKQVGKDKTPNEKTPGLIQPSKEEIDKFGGAKTNGKKDFVNSFSSNYSKLLDNYSDKDLEGMVAKKGLGGLMEEMLFKSMFGDQFENLKAKLNDDRNSMLGDEINEKFEEIRAKHILTYGMSFKVWGMDDRCGENMDILFTLFEVPPSKVQLLEKESKIDAFNRIIHTNEDRLADFIVRLPSDYVKLLIHYCKLSSFEDIAKIMRAHKKHANELRNCNESYEDPISFIGALNPCVLETLFTKFNVDSLDKYLTLTIENPEITKTIWNSSLDERKLGKIIDMFELKEASQFRDCFAAFPEGEVTLQLIDNLEQAKDKAGLGVEEARKLLGMEDVLKVLARATTDNFKVLLDTGGIKSLEELEIACGNSVISQNIGTVHYSYLGHCLGKTMDSDSDLKSAMYEAISRTYTKDMDSVACTLSSYLMSTNYMGTPLAAFVKDAFLDADYGTQNLNTLENLLSAGRRLLTEQQTEALLQLKARMGGFVTPQLSAKYIDAKSEDERESVINSYRKMMGQVLSSKKIDIEDPSILAEIIYLAYRPTGYSVNEMAKMLDWELKDRTEHLQKLKYSKQGYKMRFNMVTKVQHEQFDEGGLRAIDRLLFKSSQSPLADIVKGALSMKEKDAQMLPQLFGSILSSLEDDRVKSYKEAYSSGKGISPPYTELRLEGLHEIMRIIPKEDAYYGKLRELLSTKEMEPIARDAAERFLWLARKKKFTAEEIECKTKIDEILKNLQNSINSDVKGLLSSKELSSLGEELQSLKAMDNSELQYSLSEIRNTRFLGYSEEMKDYVDVYYGALLGKAKEYSLKARSELKKIKIEKSEESEEITAIISKNVGSYFAKAGAEICTSHNIGMWNEERHVHLNLVVKNQIIGNVMLYFEPERDYLVARGFNPRKDAMEKYDRYSMAIEITRVLKEIAKQNGYKEIFVPEQTGWHPLSNRDGMAKEIQLISKKNSALALKENTGQRTVIEEADFHVETAYGHSVDRLNLLALAD